MQSDSQNKTKQLHFYRNSNHRLKSSASIGSRDKLGSLEGYLSWPHLLKFLSSPRSWHFTRILIKSHTSVPSEVKWEMIVILFTTRRPTRLAPSLPQILRKEIKALRRSLQLLIRKHSRTIQRAKCDGSMPLQSCSLHWQTGFILYCFKEFNIWLWRSSNWKQSGYSMAMCYRLY